MTQAKPGALAGDSNAAVGFDGVDARVSVPDAESLRLNGAFSIEFWARMDGFANTWPGILQEGKSWTSGGYLVWYEANGRLHFKRNNAEWVSPPAAIAADRFRHVVITYDGSKLSWYVDGALASAGPASWPANANADPLLIGRGDHAGRQTLDEVAFYATALPATRVTAHYQAGRRI